MGSMIGIETIVGFGFIGTKTAANLWCHSACDRLRGSGPDISRGSNIDNKAIVRVGLIRTQTIAYFWFHYAHVSYMGGGLDIFCSSIIGTKNIVGVNLEECLVVRDGGHVGMGNK